MKFYDAKGEETTITWSDHQFGCNACREVVLDRSATFAHACVLGAQLLNEELKKRQAPVERKKAAANKEWANQAKTFITDRPSAALVKAAMKYK